MVVNKGIAIGLWRLIFSNNTTTVTAPSPSLELHYILNLGHLADAFIQRVLK